MWAVYEYKLKWFDAQSNDWRTMNDLMNCAAVVIIMNYVDELNGKKINLKLGFN